MDGLTVAAATSYSAQATGRWSDYLFPSGRRCGWCAGLATLSWTPPNVPGFSLQYADSFAPTNWFAAPRGSDNPQTISTTGASRYYRLGPQ